VIVGIKRDGLELGKALGDIFTICREQTHRAEAHADALVVLEWSVPKVFWLHHGIKWVNMVRDIAELERDVDLGSAWECPDRAIRKVNKFSLWVGSINGI
jgi:hypothetical protein